MRACGLSSGAAGVLTDPVLQQALLLASDGNVGDSFGSSLALSNPSFNLLRNAAWAGGVAGSPGTDPTGMSTSGTANSVVQTLAFGFDAGIPYMDVTLAGTPSITSAWGCNFCLANNVSTTPRIAQNDVLAASMSLKLQSGNLTNVASIAQRIFEYDTGGVQQNLYTSPDVSAGIIGVARSFTFTATVAGPTSVYGRSSLRIGYTSGQAINLTLRVYLAELKTTTRYLAVGAPGVTSANGAIYLFRSQAGGAWTQMTKIVCPVAGPSQNFGSFVTLSDDGSTVGIGGVTDVRVYRRLGTVWSAEGTLVPAVLTGGGFGQTGLDLSADGNIFAIGAGSQNTNAGRIFIFNRSATNVWTETTNLNRTGGVNGDLMGTFTCISGDGLYVIGAIASTTPRAVIFFNNAGVWAQQALINGTGNGDASARGVALNYDGSVAYCMRPSLATALNILLTRVERSGTNWTVVSDANGHYSEQNAGTLPSYCAGGGDYFLYGAATFGIDYNPPLHRANGSSIPFIFAMSITSFNVGDDAVRCALSAGGDTAAVGAANNTNVHGANAGCVVVFTGSGFLG